MADVNTADILSVLAPIQEREYRDTRDAAEYLKNIDAKLGSLLTNNARGISQTTAKNAITSAREEQDNIFSKRGRRNIKGQFDELVDDFYSGLGSSLTEALKTSTAGLTNSLKESFQEIADEMEIPLKDLPKEVGKSLGKALTESDTGRMLTSQLKGVTNKLAGTVGKELSSGLSALLGGEGLSGMAAAMPTIVAAAPYVAAAAIALYQFNAALEPAKEAIHDFSETLDKTSHRYYESQKQMLKNEQERLASDVKTMVEYPFQIMSKAADEWYSAWDSNLRTINQTQGYNKAQLQDLMSSYADRLRAEGLSSSVSAASISDNLANVLKSGLSGTVAEEFAYIATKLNAAIPTQDFFSYAESYAAVAANALQYGASQEEAISAANEQLEQFASNVLYASRELTGGFSTGLQNASSLFSDAVKIANTARVGDSSYISAVLTSVSAAVGAIAPDLASGLVDSVVRAATGGNDESITALRSLAGTGASNTAFLRAFAEDPQKVFATLFANLANMQNMNADNYMEVAEALGQTFGLSTDAFARVDFGTLANQISSMQVNKGSLQENMMLLGSGESTTTAESLKMQEINSMILDQGLSYVLDNEAARAIQQHMWDQEIANQIMEATYGVELTGATKELIMGISETAHNIFAILNPFSWAEKVAALGVSAADTVALKEDLKKLLELGKVGNGNTKALKNLTTYNYDRLDKPESLISLLGGTASYNSELSKQIMSGSRLLSDINGGLTSAALNNNFLSTAILSNIDKQVTNTINNNRTSSRSVGMNSAYSWAYVGKSIANAIQSSPQLGGGVEGPMQLSATQAMASKTATRMNDFLASAEKAVTDNVSYAEWISTAKNYGISDLDAALADAGLSESQLQSQFQKYQVQRASQYEHERDLREDEFWAEGKKFWQETYPYYAQEQINRQDIEIQWLTSIHSEIAAFRTAFLVDWLATGWTNDWLNTAWEQNWINTAWDQKWLQTAWQKNWIDESWKDEWLESSFKGDWLDDAWDQFYKHWLDYFVTHEVYSANTGNAYDVSGVKQAEAAGTGDAVLQLANALVTSTKDMKDPQVQTNVLLSQLLIVAEGILQAENTSSGATLPTSLSALATGLVKKV